MNINNRKKGFIKGEALRLLRTNSSEKTFEDNIINFKRRLRMRGYTDKLIDKKLPEVKHHKRISALKNKTKTHKKVLPFVTEYRPSVPNLKNIIMNKWHLIENQPLLREIFKDPPIILLQKRKVITRYTRKSQTMKLRSKTQQLSQRESCMACQHYEQYKL